MLCSHLKFWATSIVTEKCVTLWLRKHVAYITIDALYAMWFFFLRLLSRFGTSSLILCSLNTIASTVVLFAFILFSILLSCSVVWCLRFILENSQSLLLQILLLFLSLFFLRYSHYAHVHFYSFPTDLLPTLLRCCKDSMKQYVQNA